MKLTQIQRERLAETIRTNSNFLLDWAEFMEWSGVNMESLTAYLMAERAALPEEHLLGLAAAMSMDADALLARLECQSTPQKPDHRPSGTPQEQGEHVAQLTMQAIAQHNDKRFSDHYNHPWDLFEQATKPDERQTLAQLLGDVILARGTAVHRRGDLWKLTGSYNDAISLVTMMPHVRQVAMACVSLAVGVFEFKFSHREFYNINSYIDELMPVTAGLAQDEEFTLQGAICLCNLLQLCPYDDDVMGNRMQEVLDRIGELSARFATSEALQLCWLRSLVFFLCYANTRFRPEIVCHYQTVAKTTFARAAGVVPKRQLEELGTILFQNKIVL